MLKDHDSKKEKNNKVSTGKNGSICKLLLWSPAIAGTQQPDFIHGKTFREPGARSGGSPHPLPQWNRLHSQVMCQAPKAYSDSVPVLNLMLWLSHWTWGHSKVKLKLQMIEKWSARRKGKEITMCAFQTRLHWRSFCLPGLRRKNSSILQGFGHSH